MSETSENAPTLDAPGEESPAQRPGPLRVKMGKARPLMPCTRKLPGCKAPDYGRGNIFPIDHPTGTFKAPIDQVCTSCLTKIQDQGEWEIVG